MTDSNTTNVLDTIGAELLSLVKPLHRIAVSSDPLRDLRRFLRMAGWVITDELDPAPIIAGITALIETVEAAAAIDEVADLNQFIDKLGEIRDLVDAIIGVIDAIGRSGNVPGDSELTAFGEDVLHTLVISWISRKPILGDLSSVLGLIEVIELPELELGGWLQRAGGPALRFRPDRITDIAADPLGWVRSRTVPNNWENSTDAATTNLFLSRQLQPLFRRIGGAWHLHPNAIAGAAEVVSVGRMAQLVFNLELPDGAGTVELGADLEFLSNADNSGGGPAVEMAPFGRYEHDFEQGSWSLSIALLIELGGVEPDETPLLRFDRNGVTAEDDLGIAASVGATVDLNKVIGGQGTRLQLGELEVTLFGGVQSGEPDLGFEFVANKSTVVLSAQDLGSAVGAVAGEFESALEFDLGLRWTLDTGVTLAGSASLEVEFSAGVDIGGVITLDGLHLKAEIAEVLGLSMASDIAINLGPVALAFEQTGLGVELAFPPEGGNLGAADLSLDVQFPKGIGVRIDAAVVRGGGFLYLDPDNGEYAGVLELSFPALSLSLKAVGMFTSELPGGADGYALLLLIFAEFPSIQLGYGFSLNGVGGILGLQHGISTDALQDGLRTGAMDNLLFPDDPVANAPALLNDLRQVFPITPGALTFGPVLQIGWGAGIVTISLGLVIQFNDVIGSGAGDPSIARIVLLGQLKIELPPVDDAPELVKVLIDIIGYYDFEEQELGIDARIRDSHLVGLPLTGSLTVRARFGNNPTFVLAVGGFHPRFDDIPPGVPPQDRLGVLLEYDIITISIGAYVAITSNTFQIGAEASLVAKAAGFRVEAYLGFDALFIFQPTFRFEIDFRVGASIKWKKWNLASIRVSGRLTGPGRWTVVGEATFEILWWDIGIDFDVAWGEERTPALPQAAVLPKLQAALSDLDNWASQLPGGEALVTLRQEAFDGVLAHPLSTLEVRQKVVPFGIEVERVGQTRPSDGTSFTLSGIDIGAVDRPTSLSQEHFARGEFLDLSEADKLSSPSFERFDAGASVGSSEYSLSDEEIAFDPDYETFYLEQEDVRSVGRLDGSMLHLLAGYGAASYTELRKKDRLVGNGAVGLTVDDAAFAVVDPSSFELADEFEVVGGVALVQDSARSASYTEAQQLAASSGGLLMESVELGDQS